MSGDVEVEYSEEDGVERRDHLGELPKPSPGEDSDIRVGFDQGDFDVGHGCFGLRCVLVAQLVVGAAELRICEKLSKWASMNLIAILIFFNNNLMIIDIIIVIISLLQ